VQFEHTRDWRNINLVRVKPALAPTQTSRYRAVAAAGDLVLAGPLRSWKSFQWRWLPVLIPVWLLCSSGVELDVELSNLGTGREGVAVVLGKKSGV